MHTTHQQKYDQSNYFPVTIPTIILLEHDYILSTNFTNRESKYLIHCMYWIQTLRLKDVCLTVSLVWTIAKFFGPTISAISTHPHALCSWLVFLHFIYRRRPVLAFNTVNILCRYFFPHFTNATKINKHDYF